MIRRQSLAAAVATLAVCSCLADARHGSDRRLRLGDNITGLGFLTQ
jgi:hypothetical protein